ncbi:hypothetical protein D3C84_1282140 [compost metagenome]
MVPQEGGFIDVEIDIHLIERDQRGEHAGAVAGGDQITGSDHGAAGATVDRGDHSGKVEI